MISIEQLRRLLTQPPNDNTARALKEWRAHLGMSQAEAAIRLGVSRRTLQGWELGRPMPYPQLLQRTVGGTRDPYSLVQSEFPREFAEFIDFVGASALDSVVRRVDQKLGSISPASRSLYGDRYFFHEQCVRFTDGPTPFQLDVSDLVAVRAASLIAGINRVNPSCVWLHFSGFAEAEFLQLAEFSMEGKGAGLNAVVANAVHPSASTTDRSHVERIRFSATGEDLSRHPAIGPGLLISRAVSSNGFIYDVPNPLCRFPRMDGF